MNVTGHACSFCLRGCVRSETQTENHNAQTGHRSCLYRTVDEIPARRYSLPEHAVPCRTGFFSTCWLTEGWEHLLLSMTKVSIKLYVFPDESTGTCPTCLFREPCSVALAFFSCAGFPSIDSRPGQICTVMGSSWTLETNICQTLLKKLRFPHAGMPPLQKSTAWPFRKILHTFLEHLYLLCGTLHARTCCIASTFKNRHGSDEVIWDKSWINSAMDDMFFKKQERKTMESSWPHDTI